MKKLFLVISLIYLSSCGGSLTGGKTPGIKESLYCQSNNNLLTPAGNSWSYIVHTYDDTSNYSTCSVSTHSSNSPMGSKIQNDICVVHTSNTEYYEFGLHNSGSERSIKFYRNGSEVTSEKTIIPDPKITGSTSSNCELMLR